MAITLDPSPLFDIVAAEEDSNLRHPIGTDNPNPSAQKGKESEKGIYGALPTELSAA